MTNKTKLIIQNPPQYDVNVDSNLANSIFIDMYKGAANNVSAIIQKNKNTKNNSTVGLGISTTIAFVGGRGTGKSSAMHSFRAFLEKDPGKREGYKWISDHQTAKNLENVHFFALPTIDSSQISDSESIIGRMSAAMYKEYRNKQSNLSIEQKHKFIRFAKEVNEVAVMVRESKSWFKTGDRLLADTERVGNMRENVRNLVQSYLTIVSSDYGNNHNNSYLVISIDDLDMSIGNAYPIMEEIRQYLSIPQVIVLVSIDSNLLDAVMYASVKNSLKISNNDDSHMLLVKDLSYRYLEKLFPVNRRHYTPTLSAQQLAEWQSGFFFGEEITDEDFKGEQKLWESWGISSIPSVRDAVLHLIWRKTMLVPICNRDGDHLLIPHNLRSLCHMVDFLRNMPDVAYDDKKITRKYQDFVDSDSDDKNELRETLRHNLEVFGQYVATNIGSYGAPNMSTKSEINMAGVLEKIIYQLRGIQLTRMNAMIVSDILYSIYQIEDKNDIYHQILSNSVDNDDSEKYQYNERLSLNILSAAVRYPDSISVGDVMYVLGMIDTRSKCTYIRYLVEVIRTLWSVRMTEEFYVNGTKRVSIQGILPSMETYNGVDSFAVGITKDFRCAVGGFFVNPDYTNNYLSNMGWYTYDQLKEKIGEKLTNLISVYKGNNDAKEGSWRLNRDDGRPYYRMEWIAKGVINNQNISQVHYNVFSIYTNLLMYSSKVPGDTFAEWQEDNIMALPFYSFDFLYRYYEVLHESLCRYKTIDPHIILPGIVSAGIPQLYSNSIRPGYIPREFYNTIISSIEKLSKIVLSLLKQEGNLITIVCDFLGSSPEYNDNNKNKLIEYARMLDISEVFQTTSFIEQAENAIKEPQKFNEFITHLLEKLNSIKAPHETVKASQPKSSEIVDKDVSSPSECDPSPDTQVDSDTNENTD